MGLRDRYETEWRTTHPRAEPGPGLRRAWDARAWAEDRPDKISPRDGADLTERWVGELHALGYRDTRLFALPMVLNATPIGALDRDAAGGEVLTRLAAQRSAWNGADIRGEVEQLIARTGIVTDPAVRMELADDLTARTVDQCVGLLDREGVPEHIRALTFPYVLQGRG